MPTVSQIAATFYKNKQVVRRRLHNLEERGLVKVTSRRYSRGPHENTPGMTERRGDVLLK